MAEPAKVRGFATSAGGRPMLHQGTRRIRALDGFGEHRSHLYERLARYRRTLIAASALLIAWNAAMLWMFLNAHIPRSEGFPPGVTNVL